MSKQLQAWLRNANLTSGIEDLSEIKNEDGAGTSDTVEPNVGEVKAELEPEMGTTKNEDETAGDTIISDEEVDAKEVTTAQIEDANEPVNDAEDVAALEEISRDIDALLKCQYGLEAYGDFLGRQVDNGGISPETAEALAIGVEHLGVEFEEGDLPGVESFGGTASRVTATRLGAEGFIEKAKEYGKAAWDGIVWFFNKIGELFTKYVGGLVTIKGRAKGIVEKVDGLGADAKAKADTIKISGVGAMSYKGEINFGNHAALIEAQKLFDMDKELKSLEPALGDSKAEAAVSAVKAVNAKFDGIHLMGSQKFEATGEDEKPALKLVADGEAKGGEVELKVASRTVIIATMNKVVKVKSASDNLTGMAKRAAASVKVLAAKVSKDSEDARGKVAAAVAAKATVDAYAKAYSVTCKGLSAYVKVGAAMAAQYESAKAKPKEDKKDDE